MQYNELQENLEINLASMKWRNPFIDLTMLLTSRIIRETGRRFDLLMLIRNTNTFLKKQTKKHNNTNNKTTTTEQLKRNNSSLPSV